jgi:hypothetical protein
MAGNILKLNGGWSNGWDFQTEREKRKWKKIGIPI